MQLKPEGHDRADVYALLAVLLLAPDEQLIETLALIPAPPAPENAFAQAWSALVAAAARCGSAALDEHRRLFAARDSAPLEDDLGVLCEAMALLLRQQRPIAMQRAFFADHLAGAPRTWLEGIAASPAADFYRAVAGFAAAFLALEEQAFALQMQAAPAIAPIRTRKDLPTPPR